MPVSADFFDVFHLLVTNAPILIDVKSDIKVVPNRHKVVTLASIRPLGAYMM